MRILGLCLLLASAACAQDRAAIQRWTAGHQHQVIGELAQLLAIPNVGEDRANIRRNAEFLRAMLERRGMQAELLETAGNPLVYAEKNVPGAARTLLFYIHYDGQPVDAARWKQPGPFTPLMRAGRLEDGARTIANFAALETFDPNWRLYARSASDDKGPIVAFCAALDLAQGRLAGNIHVVLDGEEEMGSPSLTAAVSRYRDKLRADVLFILDGPLHPSNRPTLTFGARGIVTLELTVYGPKMALHSGHYGNWIPNPAMRLAQLLAGMKDARGRATIPGFYSAIPPFTAAQRKVLASVPDDEPALLRFFGVAQPDAVGASLQDAIQYPSLNIRGLRSGYVDEPRTIIPPDATAAIDIRLVKETPSAKMVQLVREYIERQGYHLTESAPTDDDRARYPRLARLQVQDSMEAYRTEPESPEAERAAAALRRMWGAEPVLIRTSGGTVPIAPFVRELGLPAIGVPIVNFDNNQHSDNENLRLGNLWDGIVSIASMMQP